jgi:peptidoglycan/xylan/chitin deacetylase (PgdA/CDA1 family)
MYHGIQWGTSTRHPYYETNTSPKVFALQMKYLRDNGYRALDLDEAVRSLGLGENLEERVVITFDDGLRDFYTAAYPTLKEYGLSSTMFLPTGFISDERLSHEGKEYMTWSEARELRANGVRIGSHTVSHPQLRLLAAREIDDETCRSKQIIEDKIGSSVTSFSYPFAFPQADRAFAKDLRDILQRHGYENGVSTVIGTARAHHDRFFLPRLPVNSYDDLPLFRAKLAGAYDWLHMFQYVHKLAQDTLRR